MISTIARDDNGDWLASYPVKTTRSADMWGQCRFDSDRKLQALQCALAMESQYFRHVRIAELANPMTQVLT